MNYQLYTYELPSSHIFFESKVQRKIGYVYNLGINSNGNAYLYKLEAGRYENDKFTQTLKFTQNGKQINLFQEYYPERNSYKSFCKLYYAPSGTDLNAQTYYFASTSGTTAERTVTVKSLLNDGVIFKQDGISSFCYNDLQEYVNSGNYVNLNQITLMSGDAGEKVFNAVVDDEIGYLTILDCREYIAKLVTLPVCRYYNTETSQECRKTIDITAYYGVDNNVKTTDIFSLFYPESKARENGYYKLFNLIVTANGFNYYYNNKQQKFSTNINESSWYFSEKTANLDLSQAQTVAINQGLVNNVSINKNKKVFIKDLVTYGIEFPCSSFICDNINDYIENI